MATLCLFVIIRLLLVVKSQTVTSSNGTYIHVTASKTFYEASRFCEDSYGTTLASIHSLDQELEIYELIDTVGSYPCYYSWIGLTDEYYNGHFIWTDYQPFNYSPNILNSAINTHCIWINHDRKSWEIKQCDGHNRCFICNTNPDWTLSVDLSFMPPINIYAKSTDGSMTLFNHNATFIEADIWCQRMLGTHLISITNYEESEEAQALCSKMREDILCWIGLTELFTNGYEWTDSSDTGYYRWSNDVDFSYNCGAIKSNDGNSIYSWTTNDCVIESYKTVFICSTTAPTKYPTKIPTISPITIHPTQYPSIAPSISPYDMIEIDGSYLCEELADRVAILYGITYNECINECSYNYGDLCVMINYRKDTTPSRCYIFDKQCSLNINTNNNGNSYAVFVGYKHFCIDYPINWSDIDGDSCYGYSNILGFCDDGNITDSITNSEIKAKGIDFNGMDACCRCGGGAEIINDVTMIFGEIEENKYDLLCKWNYYNNPNNDINKRWDNIMIYNLCKRLKDRINSIDLDCNQFVDVSYSGNINFISCVFDNDYNPNNNDDLYFLFIIKIMTSSTTIYINSDWFDLTDSLLSNTISSSTYNECISSLWSSSTLINNVYTVIPCDADIKPQQITTTTTSKLPTYSPTTYIADTSTSSSSSSSSITTSIIYETTSYVLTHLPTNKATYILYNNDTRTTLLKSDGNIVKDVDTDKSTTILLILILLIIIIAIIVFLVMIWIYRRNIKRKENKQQIEIDQLRLEITNLNNIEPGQTPTDDTNNDNDKFDNSPLPTEWIKLSTNDGRVYYQNNITKQTQWTLPFAN